MSKHTETKELRKEAFVFLCFTAISASVGMVLSQFTKDYQSMFILTFATIIYGVMAIFFLQSYYHRVNIEFQCKINGKNFLDLCTCKPCRIRRNEHI